MSTKVNSKHIKASAMANMRFTKQYPLVASEVGYFCSDVLAIDPDKGRFVEIEVKISKSDFMADFKKRKHEYYLKLYKEKKYISQREYINSFIPKFFYFAVPECLEDYAIEAVKDLPYGLIIYRHSNISHARRVSIKIKAKRIHNNELNKCVTRTVINRMYSEICNLHIDRHSKYERNFSTR